MLALDLPFAHLNLRFNPFGEFTLDQWGAVAVIDTARIEAHIAQPDSAVQVIGACGRGKTTHLLALRARLTDTAYVRARAESPLVLPPCRVLLLDEADALWAWQRHRAFHHAPAVVLATHRDLSWSLRLAGRTVLTVRVGGVTTETLRTVLNRRIEEARRGAGPLPRIGSDAANNLIRQFGDDVRAMEEVLYEHFQALQEVGDVEV